VLVAGIQYGASVLYVLSRCQVSIDLACRTRVREGDLPFGVRVIALADTVGWIEASSANWDGLCSGGQCVWERSLGLIHM
jgi:hypothetical protein